MKIPAYNPKTKQFEDFYTESFGKEFNEHLENYFWLMSKVAEIAILNGLSRMKVMHPTKKGQYLNLIIKGEHYTVAEPGNEDAMEEALNKKLQ